MDPLQLFASSGLVIVAGKGGVGKTTVTAAMAIAAARCGQRVLAVEMEGASGLGPLLGSDRALGPADVVLRPARPDQAGEVVGRVVSPGEALTDYLNEHGMRRMSGRLVRAGVIDVVATVAPGLDDILVLGKIKQLERSGEYDVILLDAPAAGHAVTFLRSAKGLADAVTVGPISTQANDVLELLNDATRCQVVLVTLPEETPVNELVETAFALEEEVGLKLGPVVVNGLYPDRAGLADALATLGRDGGRAHDGLVRAARFRLARQAQQVEQLSRLSARLPLHQIHLPYVFTAGLSSRDVEVLAERLLDQLGLCSRMTEQSEVHVTVEPSSGGSVAGGAATPGAALAALVAERAIIVCCGSGGVGKTTTAAVLAAEAAAQGRRAVVVTIDPARRLADALGLDGLTNEPTRVLIPSSGGGAGELWAVMLDTKRTFDHLVAMYAPDAAQAERIMGNRFYRNISAALSGTQEYMAAEKLYELHDDERFDLVVVDTPPTRNALDFLEAPGRLTRFLDHRIYRALTTPTRVGLRVVNVAAQAFLRTLSRVVGGDAIADAVAFFQAFDGMEEGFRQRANAVDHLLKSPETAYVLVTAPRRDTVTEARYFARRLGEAGTPPVAVVVNRIHPHFQDDSSGAVPRRGSRAADALAELRANLAELEAVAGGEAAELAPLTEQLGEVPMATVPLLSTDVHDLAGMAELADHLFDRAARVDRVGGVAAALAIVGAVPHVLIAADADWVIDDVRSALEGPDTTFTICRSGQDVTPASTRRLPDLAVLDLQIGNMGGMAVCMNFRLDESGGRLGHVKVLMLLDRMADVFLARRAGAEGWLVKPLDARRLRRAAMTILDGGTVYEGVPTPEAEALPVEAEASEATDAGEPIDEPARGDEVPTG